MIAVDNLKMQFGSEEILKGISTKFFPGKTSLIIGQSGSGKTVLLKCLLGLFDYEEGSIAYDEKIFLRLSPLPFLIKTKRGLIYHFHK